jgi:microcystin-dependent protein
VLLGRGQSKVNNVLEKVYSYTTAAPNAAMSNAALTPFTGGGQLHNNMMAYLALNFCIATRGTFPQPPRSEA